MKPPPPAADPTVEDVLPGEAAVAEAARRSLAGEVRGVGRVWPFLGPAFIAAVAYIDPGNFATNIAGGAKFGYLLLWVVLAANLIAMLVQTQSAKLGIATGRNLAELCRERYSRPTSIGLWIQAEVVAMACDLAEVVGAALGLNLIFGIPLFPAGLIAGAGAFSILALQRMGLRRLEAGITALVGVVVVSFVVELFNAEPDGGEVARHLFVPGLSGTESLVLATGIVGATVMPHVIYLHSALTQRRIVGRDDEEKRRILRFEKVDVVIALSIAGVVNLSMMVVAAALFHEGGLTGIDSIEGAYDGLQDPGLGRRRDGVRDRAAGIGVRLVLGRDDGRPGGDAGLHQAPDPDLPPPRDHPRPGAAGPGDRVQPDRRARPQPGGALVRDPVRAGAAAADRPRPRADGLAREPAAG